MSPRGAHDPRIGLDNIGDDSASYPEEFERLRQLLDDAHIETALEENLVRQCENDPAFWLRVHVCDLPLAWDLARKHSFTPAKD